MKRITGIFIVVLSLLLGNNKADAQTWQIGGDMTSFYVSAFRYQFSALGGYEFNDKIAVQASFGITGVENYSNYSAKNISKNIHFISWIIFHSGNCDVILT